MQLKKKQEQPYFQEIKKLTKTYKCLPKFEIKLLLQFCEFDMFKTEKILKVISDYKKPDTLIKSLIEKPQSTDEILDNILVEYKSKFGDEDIVKESQKQLSLEQEKQLKINPFFQRMPAEIMFQIIWFLNPLEMYQFISLKQKYSLLFKQMDVLVQNYFKRICKHLFTTEPKLPDINRFVYIKDYIVDRPIQFSPNVRNSVISDLRYFVWKSRPHDYRVTRQYYESFGNFQDIFVNAPRVHFNGFYCLKQKYLHHCQPTLYQPNGRYQVVHYYRYIRFFPDGSLLNQISNKKLTDDQVIKHLSITNLNQQSDTMKGEYIQFKQNVYLKFYKSCAIFNFNLTIESDESIMDKLKVRRYWMQLIDSRFITQQIYSYKQNDEKLFKYIRFQPFANQMPMNIQRCSL